MHAERAGQARNRREAVGIDEIGNRASALAFDLRAAAEDGALVECDLGDRPMLSKRPLND